MPTGAGCRSLLTMMSISIPVRRGHRRNHALRNGHSYLAARAEAVALALVSDAVRGLLPGLRPIVPPSRVVLGWQLRRLALRRAAERKEQERRRRLAAVAAVATFGVVLAGARALAARR
jgi:hypothetical protein